MASNTEWPGYEEGGSLKDGLRIRRFEGYPGLCKGKQERTACSSSSDDEGGSSSCSKRHWECESVKDVIQKGAAGAFGVNGTELVLRQTAWICRGSEEQLFKFESAANLEIVGLSLHIVFLLLLAIAKAVSLLDVKGTAKPTVVATIIASVGLLVTASLLLGSMTMIQELYTTRCSPTSPSAEDQGWHRTDALIGSCAGVPLLPILISAFIIVRREKWT